MASALGSYSSTMSCNIGYTALSGGVAVDNVAAEIETSCIHATFPLNYWTMPKSSSSF
jgi:hypothetical protein